MSSFSNFILKTHRWVYWTFIVYYYMDLWNPKRLVHHTLVQYTIKCTSGWLYRTEIVKRRDSNSWIKTFIEKEKTSIAGAPIDKDSNQNSTAQLYQLLICISAFSLDIPPVFHHVTILRPALFPTHPQYSPFPSLQSWSPFCGMPSPLIPIPHLHPHPTHAKSYSRFTFSKYHSSTSCSQPHF